MPSEDTDLLARAIRDSVAQKRVIKWGYVRQIGGIYPAECDSVAAHGCAVATLAILLATEFGPQLQEDTGVTLDLQEVALMAIFHDYGEGRSGDTGAASYSARGYCNLHHLEGEGLSRSLREMNFQPTAERMFKTYRSYSSPEAILVHVADNLEGFEKALHAARGSREILADAVRIMNDNLTIYEDRRNSGSSEGVVAEFYMSKVLVPGCKFIARQYGHVLQVQEGLLCIQHP